MRWPQLFSHPPIGVDVSSRWIAAAQVVPAARGSCVRAAVCVARSGGAAGAGPPTASDRAWGRRPAPDAAELARFAEVLDRRGFRGSDVVLAAPDDRLISAAMELPPRSSGAPVVELAKVELSRTHKLSPDAFEVALWEAPGAPRSGSASGGQYMAAALRHEDGEALASAFEGAGLRARAIDARAWALARACAPRTGEGAAALLDLGESGAVLVLVQSGSVAYQRVVPEAGVDGLRAGLGASIGSSPEVIEFVLGGGGRERAREGSPDVEDPVWGPQLPDEAWSLIDAYVEAIAAEARAALEYVSRRLDQRGVDRLLVAGAGARVPGVVARLGVVLGVDASVASPADLGECAGEIADVCRDPRLTAAVGLAAHEEGAW